MMFTRPARHLNDGELLRLMDADGASDELARFDAHAGACPRCAAGLRSLRLAAGLVRERLQEVEGPAEYALPAGALAAAPVTMILPLWSRGWARAAVLLLALAGALVAVRPLRARIGSWMSAAWAELAGGAPARVAAPAAAPALAPAPTPAPVLWFTPAGAELRLVVSARQAAGTLTLGRTRDASASLEVVPSDAGVAQLASERLLEIRNPARARSSYTVRVPAAVRSVVVTIDGEAPRTFGAAALDAGVQVQLGPLGTRR